MCFVELNKQNNNVEFMQVVRNFIDISNDGHAHIYVKLADF